MTSPAIMVEGLGKRYRIGALRQKRKTLRETLNNAAMYPFQRMFSRNGVHEPAPQSEDHIWALQDVSFSIQPGEVVGIIGHNGAGKSTLLKILSRITEPTNGYAEMEGRLGSLLEVGTGFHPELTGRENVYLNGAILGMRRVEIDRAFDAIVAFAELEKFIDTPVKHYSTGMYLRLAFAVAAQLEPDVLIVDEVLAVGDYRFQKKCIEKMNEVAHHKRTVLFVSHNLQAVRLLCNRGIVLNQGRVVADSRIEDAIHSYNELVRGQQDLGSRNLADRSSRTSGFARVMSVQACDEKGEDRWTFQTGETVSLRVAYDVVKKVDSLAIYAAIRSGKSGENLTSIQDVVSTIPVDAGSRGNLTIEFPDLPLRPGDYGLYIALGNETYDRFYDVVDENVALPKLCINSDSKDPHQHTGYFNVKAVIKASKA